MTVKTAPERAGVRKIKNKLVQLIHNVVPPHSRFSRLRGWGRIIYQMSYAAPGAIDESQCAEVRDVGSGSNRASGKSGHVRFALKAAEWQPFATCHLGSKAVLTILKNVCTPPVQKRTSRPAQWQTTCSD
jgi:hypothetical protein